MIITILTFLSSCDKIVYFDIPQNEKPLLNNNDTVCFIDLNGKIDSFLIKRTDNYRISDKRYYHQEIIIQYKNINLYGSIRDFRIEHRGSTSIYVDGYYFPSIYKNDLVINLDIKGLKYINVYNLKSLNYPDTIPKSIYYSHKKGIIKYDFSDSSYEIINK